jgi:hypothetical protein
LVADIATKTVSSLAGFSTPPLHRAAESFHRRDLTLTGDSHLTCWKNALIYVALDAIH